jgi:hypothetical protein
MTVTATAASGELVITPVGSNPIYLILTNATIIEPLVEKVYDAPQTLVAGSYMQLTPPSVSDPAYTLRYKVRIKLTDQEYEDIFMGTVSNQVTWTNDFAGQGNAITAIQAARA